MKGQDVLVGVVLSFAEREMLAYSEIASRAQLSASETHACVARLQDARLVDVERQLQRRKFIEFLEHGLPYVFPAKLGAPSLGIPTGPSAPGVAEAFDAPELWVWPSPLGDERGPSIEPLYRSVPQAAKNDSGLYRILSLIDCLRIGRAREKALGLRALKKHFSNDAKRQPAKSKRAAG